VVLKMFNKNIIFNIEDIEIAEILKERLNVYPIADGDYDIEINFVKKINISSNYFNNPSTHFTFKNGFVIDFGTIKVRYTKEELLLKIDVEVNKRDSFISKFRSINYESTIDSIGELLHELVLIPMNFFDQDCALIHASSMKNTNTQKVIMIGGTGGVGKTSLELALCRELGYSFISDDIAVVSSDLAIYPNLSYPKIYAYNISNNIDLYKSIFTNRSFVDKFQWSLLKKIRGSNKVRRSISPSSLFNSYEKYANKIDSYYILSRTDKVDNIEIKELKSEDAAEMTLKIIKNEYTSVLQHIIWHEYNALLYGSYPIIKELNLYKKWFEIYKKIFSNIDCFVIYVPVNISHNDFLKTMKSNFK